MDYLEVHGLIFKCLEIFSLSFQFTDFYFNSIMAREHTLYDFSSFKFSKKFSMIQNMVYFSDFPCTFERKYSLLRDGPTVLKISVKIFVFILVEIIYVFFI